MFRIKGVTLNMTHKQTKGQTSKQRKGQTEILVSDSKYGYMKNLPKSYMKYVIDMNTIFFYSGWTGSVKSGWRNNLVQAVTQNSLLNQRPVPPKLKQHGNLIRVEGTGRKLGLTNLKPWTDHVIWGPMRGLASYCMGRGHIYKHIYMFIYMFYIYSDIATYWKNQPRGRCRRCGCICCRSLPAWPVPCLASWPPWLGLFRLDRISR